MENLLSGFPTCTLATSYLLSHCTQRDLFKNQKNHLTLSPPPIPTALQWVTITFKIKTNSIPWHIWPNPASLLPSHSAFFSSMRAVLLATGPLHVLFFLPGKLSTIYHLANPSHPDPGLSTTSLETFSNLLLQI